MSLYKTVLLSIFCAISISTFAEVDSADCIVTKFSEVSTVGDCDSIIVRNLTAPGGQTCHFHLKDGAKLTFEGTSIFGYAQWPEWNLPLIHIKGYNLTVEGAPGSVLDGQGVLYWDGLGDKGPPKPFFISINATDSVFRNINLINCPHHCTIVNGSNGVTIHDWNIDCSFGDGRGGHNTDGFDVMFSSNIVIRDSSVINQDDCVAVNQGFNMHFSGLYCSGSHGISLSVGFSKTSYFDNTLKNVTYSNCTLVNSINAIHIKTHNDGGPGEITDVTYENIRFSDIINFGINIQQDYADGGSTGIVKGNIPIKNLVFRDIKGSLADNSRNSTPVYIFCADDACEDWDWSEVEIDGGVEPSWCNFEPDGYKC